MNYENNIEIDSLNMREQLNFIELQNDSQNTALFMIKSFLYLVFQVSDEDYDTK